MSHKSTINALLTGALFLAGSASFAQTAQDPTSLIVGVYPTKQEGKICLAVEKKPNTTAFVQLLTPTGEELYSATLPKKDAKFRQTFDLHELTDGTYILRVKQGESLIIKSFELQTFTPNPTAPARSLTLGN